jgi:hypothetical protein
MPIWLPVARNRNMFPRNCPPTLLINRCDFYDCLASIRDKSVNGSLANCKLQLLVKIGTSKPSYHMHVPRLDKWLAIHGMNVCSASTEQHPRCIGRNVCDSVSLLPRDWTWYSWGLDEHLEDQSESNTRPGLLAWAEFSLAVPCSWTSIRLSLLQVQSTLASIANNSQTWICCNCSMQTSKLVILSEGFLHCHLKPAWRGKWCTRDTANVPHCPKAQSPASYNRGLISVTAWHIPGQYSIHGQGKPPAHHPNRYHSQRAETGRQIILHDAVWHT